MLKFFSFSPRKIVKVSRAGWKTAYLNFSGPIRMESAAENLPESPFPAVKTG